MFKFGWPPKFWDKEIKLVVSIEYEGDHAMNFLFVTWLISNTACFEKYFSIFIQKNVSQSIWALLCFWLIGVGHCSHVARLPQPCIGDTLTIINRNQGCVLSLHSCRFWACVIFTTNHFGWKSLSPAQHKSNSLITSQTSPTTCINKSHIQKSNKSTKMFCCNPMSNHSNWFEQIWTKSHNWQKTTLKFHTRQQHPTRNTTFFNNNNKKKRHSHTMTKLCIIIRICNQRRFQRVNWLATKHVPRPH